MMSSRNSTPVVLPWASKTRATWAPVRRIVASAALLRSPQDGEVLAAARAVERLLSPHGLRLDAVVEAGLSQRGCRTKADSPRPDPSQPKHHKVVRWCLERQFWNDRELAFQKDIMRVDRLSAKQSDWLQSLYERRGRR